MARDEQTTPLAFPERLSNLATTIGDRPAVSDASGSLSFDELWRSSSALAHRYRELGVSFGDIVSIALPSDRSFIVAAVAAWILGATPSPSQHEPFGASWRPFSNSRAPHSSSAWKRTSAFPHLVPST